MEAVGVTPSNSASGPSESLQFARATIRDIVPYPTERTPCAADLSDNTNLFGAPPAALRELANAGREDITRYPGLYTRRLREALADYAGVRTEEVVTGCGSDDVIDSAVRAFAEPGELLAYSDPTFSMIPVFAKVNGLVPTPVPFTASLDIDADALLATGARVIYICSPNNPTGVLPSRAAVDRVIAGAPGVVILDEAYGEFTGAGRISDGPAHERLLVTRTLSKAFGMAGFRIGYATGSASLVRDIERVRGPYKENAPGERAAAAALREDVDWMREMVALAVEERERFATALRAHGLHPYPSAANFILLPVPHAARIALLMRQRGVAVRPYPGLRGIGDTLRITIGPSLMMELALDALLSARDAVARESDLPAARDGT
jgi:histidinol-phosphate aminotransferase